MEVGKRGREAGSSFNISFNKMSVLSDAAAWLPCDVDGWKGGWNSGIVEHGIWNNMRKQKIE